MLRLSCFFVALSAGSTVAEDWPGWRGPRRDGTADKADYPTKWTAKDGIKWKRAIPGVGHSSPVIVAGKVFLTTCLENEGDDKSAKPRMLLCYDRVTGEQLWAKECLAAPLEGKHKLNSHASSTPVSDGARIYVPFAEGKDLRVFCYDLSGKKIWDATPGEFHSVHGFCSSPMLYKDLLIVNGDQDPKKDGKAYLVAFDKLTGREKWRVDRSNRLRSYCPPVLIEVDGKPQMVLTGSKSVCSFDPETGAPIWNVKGPTEQFVSSVVFHRGTVFLTAGFPEHWLMAIDPTGAGDVTKTKVLWSKKGDGGYVPSPVAHDGKAFVVADDGIFSCWDLKMGGAPFFHERLGGHQSGSPVVASGRIYFTDDTGLTYVVEAGEKLKVLSKNPIGEKCFSSPAFSDGDIFIRGEKSLFCIGGK